MGCDLTKAAKENKMKKRETNLGVFELEGNDGEYHIFYIMKTATRLKFGSVANIGFLEDGYMVIDKYFSLDENLQELIADLEVGINDGVQYMSRAVAHGQKTGKL
jgi:hypothetical protein